MSPTDATGSGADDPGASRLIGRLHPQLELFATILLAMAAVATAWSSYQSARWSGVQAPSDSVMKMTS